MQPPPATHLNAALTDALHIHPQALTLILRGGGFVPNWYSVEHPDDGTVSWFVGHGLPDECLPGVGRRSLTGVLTEREGVRLVFRWVVSVLEPLVLPLLDDVDDPRVAMQCGALVSFIASIGPRRFASSDVRRLFRLGDIDGAGLRLLHWCGDARTPDPALLVRREAERRMLVGAPDVAVAEGLSAVSASVVRRVEQVSTTAVEGIKPGLPLRLPPLR